MKTKENVNVFVAFKLSQFSFCKSLTIPLETLNNYRHKLREKNSNTDFHYMLQLLVPCLIGECQYEFKDNGFFISALALYLRALDETNNNAVDIYKDMVSIRVQDDETDELDTLHLKIVAHYNPITEYGNLLYREFISETDTTFNLN